MTRFRITPRGLCLLLAVGLLLAGGCGRRSAPQPPRVAAPAPPGNVRAEVEGQAVLLSWVRPAQRVDGSPLHDLEEFRIVRQATGEAVFTPVATVRASYPDNAQVQGPRYLFRDDGSGEGLDQTLGYTYRVHAVGGRGLMGPASPEARVEFLAPPPVPTGLRAAVGEAGVELTWQAPAPPPGQASVAVRGYNVYRGSRPGVYAPQPINARPLTETRFRDGGLTTDTTYYYTVRSAGSLEPPWRESPGAPEVMVTPVDLTPPAAPQGLAAIAGPGQVALSWRAGSEPDLLGYLVYRREPPAVTPLRLTDAPLQTTAYTDRTVRPGGRYVYTVTAVDRAARRNESPPSAEADATLP